MQDAISIFTKASNLDKGLGMAKVREAWYSLMSGPLAKYTSKINFENGVLTVFSTSPIYKKELSMTKNALIEQLNSILKMETVKQLIIK
jgi:hypothetical protein